MADRRIFVHRSVMHSSDSSVIKDEIYDAALHSRRPVLDLSMDSTEIVIQALYYMYTKSYKVPATPAGPHVQMALSTNRADFSKASHSVVESKYAQQLSMSQSLRRHISVFGLARKLGHTRLQNIARVQFLRTINIVSDPLFTRRGLQPQQIPIQSLNDLDVIINLAVEADGHQKDLQQALITRLRWEEYILDGVSFSTLEHIAECQPAFLVDYVSSLVLRKSGTWESCKCHSPHTEDFLFWAYPVCDCDYTEGLCDEMKCYRMQHASLQCFRCGHKSDHFVRHRFN
jgi:hypothetical protein